MHGWIILDKPYGMGSTQAVSAVKRALREGGYPKVKVGHGGTLDPLATGVLPIAIGEATKLAGRMLDASKIYEFEVRFGEETDTLDREGKVIAQSGVRPLICDIDAVLPQFTGDIEQIPPAYSALKIDGERAYDLARRGKAVEPQSRRVTIHRLECWAGLPVRSAEITDSPAQFDAVTGSMRPWFDHRRAITAGKYERLATAHFRAEVSKGTYIRSLARDIARALGTTGHVSALDRDRAGPFWADDAISLDKLFDAAKRARLEALVRPIEDGLDGIPALILAPDQAVALRQGRALFGQTAPDGLHFAKLGETPVALVKAEAGEIRVERGFNI